MEPPILSLSNPPALSEQLRRRTNGLLSRLVRANCNTQFAQTVSELAEFRHATNGFIDGMDDQVLSETFQNTVPFTAYDSYAPFIARLLENPCKASSILDLFAPGFPDHICKSSSTSGGLPKAFPKYNWLSQIRSSDARTWTVSDPFRRRTKMLLFYMAWDQMDVQDEDSRPMAKIYVTCATAYVQRILYHLGYEKDEEKMATFVLDHTTPYAVAFIKKWRSFLLIHALFAVGSRSLETISMVFINAFVDMIRQLDVEFDTVVDCIANGTIPDLDGIAEVRHHLESNILPDPERASELRRLGRPSSRPGWCGLAWPKLRSVIAVTSGNFASTVPLAQWFLGSNAEILAPGYGSTESWIGLPYNPRERNQFKPYDQNIFEFLDISKSESINDLAQLWEVEQGRRYEIVLTTQDGLWRYRLGDIVEVSGFDPRDGVPIIQFIERRNMAIRFPAFMITEAELRASILFAFPDKVVGWTSVVDDQLVPATVGFFVELVEDQSTDLSSAPERILEKLSQLNETVARAIIRDLIRKPRIRLVRPGTFRDFMQLKLDEDNGIGNLGQIKVPVVLPKAEYVAWFSKQVMQEL